MTARISVHSGRIAAFCERWRAAAPAPSGFVLRDGFGPGSNADALIGFGEGARPYLFGMVRMERDVPHPVSQPERLVPPESG